MNYSDDPNDPNNPFGNCYKRRAVYELHIGNNKKSPPFNTSPVQAQTTAMKNNITMITPYTEVNTPFVKIPFSSSQSYFGNQIYMISGDLSISFKGEIKSQKSILKAKFESEKPTFSMQFETDGNNALSNVKTNCDFNFSNLKNSSCTVTVNNTPYVSTSVSVSGGAPTLDASTQDSGAGSSGITVSPFTPTFITFHFDTTEFKAKSGDSLMKGHINIKISLTVMPLNQDNASPSPAVSNAWNTATSRAEAIFINGAGAMGNPAFPLNLTLLNPIPVIQSIMQRMVNFLESPAPSDNNDLDGIGSAIPAVPKIPDVIAP